MKELYRTVSDRLNRVDFSRLWPGFVRGPFALYDDETVCFGDKSIPCDERFLGNTSILLDGTWTAIWNVKKEEDPDELAAHIVHEMFHSYQYARGESRFPDDLEILRLGLDEKELALRALECAILAETHPCLARFADARARRRAENRPLVREAERAETVEGMAEYMGMTAYSMIAPEKGRGMRAAYSARLRDAEFLTDTRQIAYFTGALLLAAAREAGIEPFHEVGHETHALGEIITAQLESKSAGAAPDVSAIAKKQARCAAERCEAFRNRATRITRRAKIMGYDPMNMTRAGDLILCERFVMLDGELIMEPVLLEMVAGAKDETTAIYREGRVVS